MLAGKGSSRLKGQWNPHATQLVNEAREELCHLRAQQEIYWKQRAKQHWMERGDQTAQQNAILNKPFEEAEIKATNFSMHPDKAPAPGGLTPGFSQAYWDIVGDKITNACPDYLNSGSFL